MPLGFNRGGECVELNGQPEQVADGEAGGVIVLAIAALS